MNENQGETVNKMNPEVKARWVAALRSGEYKQGKGELRSAHDCFCCLGVLCDLKGDGWIAHEADAAGPYSFDDPGCFDYPPERLKAWAELDWSRVEVQINGHVNTLADHNDAGCTFSEIADAIEAQL